MKFLALIVICVTFTGTNGNVKKQWELFKVKYCKNYTSQAEELKRFSIFKKNMREIKNHNRDYKLGKHSYKKGQNSFSDMTEKEFTKKYNLWIPEDVEIISYDINDEISQSDSENGTIENLDWREQGYVTAVKDQGTCGSCWIFSAIGALEGFHYNKTGKLVSLSEQNVIDCYSNSTCFGGFPEKTLQWVKVHGINSERDYPYKEKHTNCAPKFSKLINLSFNEIIQVNNSEAALKEALSKNGPIIVSLYVTSRWRFYKSGVWYDKECAEVTNHSMLLVGFGTENGKDYWLIKNSWGKDWGDKGYIKVARNRHENYCGITSESLYVV